MKMDRAFFFFLPSISRALKDTKKEKKKKTSFIYLEQSHERLDMDDNAYFYCTQILVNLKFGKTNIFNSYVK